jgi:hypothetical protein
MSTQGGHLGGIGLDLMLALLASDDQGDLSGSDCLAERHRQAGMDFTLT